MKIVLMAHDNKKKLMQNLCVAYRHVLGKHELYATGTTGQLVSQTVNLPVHKYLSRHLGGEQQVATQVAHNDVDLLVFLRDPFQRGDEYDSKVLLLCDAHNIPVATNPATAETLFLALDRGDLDWRNLARKS